MKAMQVVSALGWLTIALGWLAIAAVMILAILLVQIAFGWLWALRVLAGNIKLGPKEMWDAQVARRDLGVRRTELKVAWGVLASYLCAAAIAISMMFSPAELESDAVISTLRLVALAISFPALAGIAAWLYMIGIREWQHATRRLEFQLLYPTPF